MTDTRVQFPAHLTHSVKTGGYLLGRTALVQNAQNFILPLHVSVVLCLSIQASTTF
jgi:hypothetical protein